MARFLVTGGGGFIGSNIVEALVSQDHFVRVLDNFSTGRTENLAAVERSVEVIEGDIRSLLTVERAVKDVDFVLHQAALPSVPRSIADPGTTNEVNVSGTLNVLNAAREAGIRRVVIASSSSVYGSAPGLPKREDMIPSPLSPYAVSKFTSELYARVFQGLYGLEVVVLRYFNVFGKHQNPDSQYSAVIPKFCKALLHNVSPTIFGDGGQSRDFTHVENVVSANILACTTASAAGTVINVASGSRHTVNELFDKLKDVMGASVKPTYLPERKGEVRDSYADISLAKQVLGYTIRTDLDRGLELTADYFRQYYSPEST